MVVDVAAPTKPSYKPYGYWTLRQQKFVFTPDKSVQLPLFYYDKKIDAGIPFVIDLGDDVPAGKCEIKIHLLKPKQAYLAMVRLQPRSGRARFYKLSR